MTDILSDPRFAVAAQHFALACRASRLHDKAAREALETYGDHGPLISGCVRSHFPPEVKDYLRRMARAVTTCSEAGYAARPRYVRHTTMVHLARLVATRDGSGYYGPQPYREARCGPLA